MSSRSAPRHRAAAPRRLPRLALGGVAATVAVVLLLGGQGSLASWKSQRTIGGAAITTGSISIDAPTCTWTLTSTATGGTAVSYSTQPLQPGDTLKATCTTTVHATGEHMRGTVTAVAKSPLSSPLVIVGTPTVTAGGTFTEGNTPVQATATVSVTTDDAYTDPAADGPATVDAGFVAFSVRQVHA